MNLKDQIKEEIIEVLTLFGDRVLTGFLSLDKFKKLAIGDLTWSLSTIQDEDSNIVLLSHINNEAIRAFNELKQDGIIEMLPCSALTASTEGPIYKFPVAYKLKVYKGPRWLPTIVKKGPKFDHSKHVPYWNCDDDNDE